MGKYQSSKVFDGFSTVFRQWKAEETHCRFLHGYGISFKVYFEGDLDDTKLGLGFWWYETCQNSN
jgi:6-pyruvoyltetrahydropterin/6-carboxytetrahydropterin synthase